MTDAGCEPMFSPASRSPHIFFPLVWETPPSPIYLPRSDFTPVYLVDSFSGCSVVRGTQSSQLRQRSRCSSARHLARSRVAIQHASAHSLQEPRCLSHSLLSSRG